MQEVYAELAKFRVAARQHSGNTGAAICEQIVNNFQFRVAVFGAATRNGNTANPDSIYLFTIMLPMLPMLPLGKQKLKLN